MAKTIFQFVGVILWLVGLIMLIVLLFPILAAKPDPLLAIAFFVGAWVTIQIAAFL